ncbi:MAG: 4'-phosphopantetheinyl transferase superfamily protein [Candidatus Marithrix sp.]|nr:4'-phosphopantetheinyl transferase superfamily protein [Candidatus Marithrix sp.]
MLKIAPDEVHLWLAFPNLIQEPELLSAYNELLTKEEHQLYLRKHQKHKHQYLVTRALIRSVLSRYINLKPSVWRFSKNKYGRPEVITDELPLRFNLSHTKDLIVCAVVLKQDIGVDIENIEHNNTTNQDVAQRFFSIAEAADLRSNPTRSFFDYWTLKESYIKARGMGLSIPLHKFTFHIADHIKISFNSDLSDDSNQWQFWLLEPSPLHRMALAICDKANYRLNMKVTIPLLSEQDFNCPILSH